MENQIEIWRPVVGFEDIYEVSSFGRVKSLLRVIEREGVQSYPQTIKEKILCNCIHKSGYYYVLLRKNKKPYTKKVHRLIADAFIPNPNKRPQVNHINGIKTDNSISNLEWVTPKQNVHHAWETGLAWVVKGPNHPRSSSVHQLNNDGAVAKTFDFMKTAEQETGIKAYNISACCQGFQKTAGGYKWRYA